MLPINNAVNSLELGSKLHTKCFTLNNTYRFSYYFFCKYLKKRKKLKEKKYILKIKSIKTGEKLRKIVVSRPGFEPGHSPVALLCTNL